MTATVDDHDVEATADGAEHPAVPTALVGVAPALLVTLLAGWCALDRPLWLDESYTLAATRDLGTAFEAARGSMGLYYAFAWAWGHLTDSGLGLRLPSILAIGAAVLLFSRLVARQHGVDVARWAGLGVAVSFPTVAYGHDARSYAFVALASVAAWWALDRGVADADDVAAWRWHRACCVALPLLHGLAAVQLVAQAAVLVAAGVGGRSGRRAAVGLGLGLATVAGALAVGAGRSGDWLPPLSVSAARTLVDALTVPVGQLGLVAVVAVLVAACVLVRRATAATSALDRFRLLVPVAWGPGAVAGILAISVVRPSYLARYSMAAVFGLVLTLAIVAVGLDRRRSSGLPLAALALVLSLGTGGLVAVTDDGPAWDEATDVVATGAEPGDVLVFPTADARLPFDAEWRSKDRDVSPAVAGSPLPLGAVRRSLATPTAGELSAALGEARRVWVVEQEYHHVPNPDLLGERTVQDRYRVEDTWELGDRITVHLLVAR